MIAGFAGACALGLLAIGPAVMTAVLGDKGFTYSRGGLALVAVGMGFHLIAGTLNQAALARNRAGLAAAAWGVSAVLFVGWVLAPVVSTRCCASRSATSARRSSSAGCCSGCTGDRLSGPPDTPVTRTRVPAAR